MTRRSFAGRMTLGAAALALAAAAGATPEAPVQALDAGLTGIEAPSQSFAARYAALAPVVDQAFNLPQILQTIVGLQWAGLPPAQKAQLQTVFRAYTVANYVSNFGGGDAQFRLLPDRRQIGNDTVVATEIAPKSGDSTRIDYVVRQGSGGWQVVDVLPQGTISQVAVQRSDFRSLISPGDASQLIARLQDKVQTLSGGAIKP